MPSSLAVIHSSTLGFSPRPPVSVCGTGGCTFRRLAGFLGSLIRDAIPLAEAAGYYQVSAGLAYLTTKPIPTPFNALFRQCAVLSLLRHRIAICSRCWNINQLSIDLSLRIGLRTRLTLIRLALIRKPWSFGVRVSRPHYRYLCLHLLFQALQHPLPGYLRRTWNAPLPLYIVQSAASVPCLMPDYYRCPLARPVSCYALFKGMAASKPTSWLSEQVDPLCST